jgi:hypothetical protein
MHGTETETMVRRDDEWLMFESVMDVCVMKQQQEEMEAKI